MDIFISYGSKAYVITALICLPSNIQQNPTSLFKIIEEKQSWTELSQFRFCVKINICAREKDTKTSLPKDWNVALYSSYTLETY